LKKITGENWFAKNFNPRGKGKNPENRKSQERRENVSTTNDTRSSFQRRTRKKKTGEVV